MPLEIQYPFVFSTVLKFNNEIFISILAFMTKSRGSVTFKETTKSI